MYHNQGEAPDPRDLIIAKGCHKGFAFVCIGVYRAKGKHRHVINMSGGGYPWSDVSRWEYVKEALPDYDVWAPDASRNILSDGREQYMATSGV